MKPWIKFFIGLVALLMGTTAHAQGLRATGITASPGSAFPGDSVTFTVAVSNSEPADFTGTVDFSITLTHLVTGSSFAISGNDVSPVGGLVSRAVIDPQSGQSTPGSGRFEVTGNVPISTTEAGNYRASVRMDGGAPFSVSTNVLTVTGTPDLRITSLTYPAGVFYKGGDVVPMTLTYTNAIKSTNFNVPWVPTADSNYFRIEVILSSNPTFGDADDFLLTFHDIVNQVNADSVNRAISWHQLLPGNFPGSYYVLAKIDTLEQVAESTSDDDFTIHGNNVWYDTRGTRIALEPTSFPTVYLASTTGATSGNSYSDNPAVSGDGRYTVFVSDATDLVEGDTNSARDVFLYDNQTQTVRRVNISQQGAQANGWSSNPAISTDGRFVAFASDATNLVFSDTNGFTDIFVVDTVSGAITRESVATGGGQANGTSFRATVSGNGRYVTFESFASNLAGSVTWGTSHIYLRDRTAGTTILISQSGGVAGNAASTQAVISADARYVAFASDASNLVSGDFNGVRDIFLRDVTSGLTTRISVSSVGIEGNGPSRAPSINRSSGSSNDGRYIAFSSEASNLVASDLNGISDIFVYDRVTGSTTRLSVSSTGVEAFDPTNPGETGSHLGSVNPSISSTGRFVAFASLANNLSRGDAAGRYQTSDGNGSMDVLVRDRDVADTGVFDTAGNVATQLVSVNRFGYQTIRILGIPSTAASDIYPAVSDDGRWVAFPTDSDQAQGLAHLATNRLSNDQNGFRDVFLHDRRTNALPNPVALPTVTIASPTNGSTVRVNTGQLVQAEASTPNGTIRSVQFFANSDPIGAAVTSPPYQVQWTPTTEGVFRLTAVALDSVGALATSDTVVVMASSAPADATLIGNYQGLSTSGAQEAGNVALITMGGRVAIIGHSTTAGVPEAYFASNIPLNSSGGFSFTDATGQVVSGNISETGVNGTLDDSRLTFIGLDTKFVAGGAPTTPRFFLGSLAGRPGSQIAVIVGSNGSISLYVSNGSFEDAGGGNLADSSGSFAVTSMRGNQFSGRIDPTSGVLTVTLSGPDGGTFTASPIAVTGLGANKVAGEGTEVGANITHVNGNIYDQVLLQGTSATISADPGQITRLSYLDLTGDIVQVEFSGAGSLTITLANTEGPMVAAKYNQPEVRYMKGHASILVTGADETTNLSIFSVGLLTAQNSSLFDIGERSDGVADLADVVILSPSGRFGGLRTGNANYWATRGLTGLCAPGVHFASAVYLGDISADSDATPLFLIGSSPDIRITGGSLRQANGMPVQVSGVSALRFTAGSTSHGGVFAAQNNGARFVQNGVDVAAPVASPTQ